MVNGLLWSGNQNRDIEGEGGGIPACVILNLGPIIGDLLFLIHGSSN